VDTGIEVRLLYPSAVPRDIRGQITDFILFDDKLSYETTPVPHVDRGEVPMILSSRLELRDDRLSERILRYRNIWESGSPWVDVSSTDRLVTAVPDES
jgi:hypothetical protein